MVVVRVGVDKDLDDRDHPEQRYGCNSRRQAKEQENGNGQFLNHRDAGSYSWVQQGHSIFVFEQLHREFPRVVLQQSRFEERHANADPPRQLNDRERKLRQNVPHSIQPFGAHDSAPLTCETLVTRPACSISRTARPGSKLSSVRVASSAAHPSVLPWARARRKS